MSPTIYLCLHSVSLHDTLMLLTTDYDNLVTRCVLANNSSYAINCWLLQQGCLSQGKYHFRVQIGRRVDGALHITLGPDYRLHACVSKEKSE